MKIDEQKRKRVFRFGGKATPTLALLSLRDVTTIKVNISFLLFF
jgi:hypothetical protein